METSGTLGLWIGFIVVVVAGLGLDLYLGSKQTTPMTHQSALRWTVFWVGLAAAFGVAIYVFEPPEKSTELALLFTQAYIIEYSLSVDNLFVFLLLFSSFKVPREHQPRVLYWGIIGAVVLRAIFIFTGSALLQRFEWLMYVFGAFLLFTGIKLVFGGGDEDTNVEDNKIVLLAKRFVPVTPSYHGKHFFVVVDGLRKATPLFLVVVCVEFSDLVFALDSIPAVFGVSRDPFIVYTSNIFAIMGLRSLFFLLAGALNGLRFLPVALGLVLAFIGGKMLLPLGHEWLHQAWIPEHIATGTSLAIVGTLLGAGIALSLLFPGKEEKEVSAANEVKRDIHEALHPEDEPKPPPSSSSES